LTFIRSVELDQKWTWEQLRSMQVGGNALATAFFRANGCNKTSKDKYHSSAAVKYKSKISKLAHEALRKYDSSVLHLPSKSDSDASNEKEPSTAELDFFSQYGGSAISDNMKLSGSFNKSATAKSSSNKISGKSGPRVDAALNTWQDDGGLAAAETRRSSKEADFFSNFGSSTKKNGQQQTKETPPEAAPEKEEKLQTTQDGDDDEWPDMDDDVKPVPIPSPTVTPAAPAKQMEPTVKLSASVTPRTNLSSTIISKKKKGGLGKKSGFGAQRVKTNFSRLEEKANEETQQQKQQQQQQTLVTTEMVSTPTSARLAYQDPSNTILTGAAEKKKKEASNRLGMASVGNTRAQFSHTVDMTVIEQDDPLNGSRKSSKNGRNGSKRGGMGGIRRNQYLDDSSEDSSDARGDDIKVPSYMKSIRDEQRNKPEDKNGGFKSNRPTRSFKEEAAAATMKGSMKDQLKGSKAISSDMLFEGSSNPDECHSAPEDDVIELDCLQVDTCKQVQDRRMSLTQARSRMNRFDNQESISSNAFFGKEEKDASTYSLPATLQSQLNISSDMGQLKESVRNAAGRLSSMANSVYNSIPMNR